MAYLNNYEAYGHGNAPTAPAGDENGNIVGLELEISQLLDADYLEELIADGYIGTWDSEAPYIQLEEEAQCDVQYELIFNADTAENVISRLREIESLNIDVSNRRNCSAHVHVNRRYMQLQGISERDYYKAADAIAPLIYAVSGRDSSSWNEWTPEHIDLFNRDMLERFNHIDGIMPKSNGSYNDRYELCNCQNSSTIEIRGFSNYYEFETDLIAFYIAIASELLPEIALKMQGRTYAEEWEEVIKITSKFLKPYAHYVNRFNLEKWSNYKEMKRQQRREALNAAIESYEDCQLKISQARQHQHSADRVGYALKIIGEILVQFDYIKLDAIEIADIKATLDAIEDQNQTHFKNNVWRS